MPPRGAASDLVPLVEHLAGSVSCIGRGSGKAWLSSPEPLGSSSNRMWIVRPTCAILPAKRVHVKDGRRLGQSRLASITTAVTDAVYEKLLFVTEVDANGNTVRRERRTSVNHAMKTCRRAWNVAA